LFFDATTLFSNIGKGERGDNRWIRIKFGCEPDLLRKSGIKNALNLLSRSAGVLTMTASTSWAEKRVMAMSSTQRTIVGLVTAILLASGLGCASTQNVNQSGSEPATREACFDSRMIRSFFPLHERFVFIEVGSDEHYLLTLDKLPPDADRKPQGRPLAGVITITGSELSNTFHRVCWDTMAQASYIEAGEPVFRLIRHIEAVASKKAAQRLVEQRTARKP
jgi:hypothetical protein